MVMIGNDVCGVLSAPECWIMRVGRLGKMCGGERLGVLDLSWAAAIAGELLLLEMNKEGAMVRR